MRKIKSWSLFTSVESVFEGYQSESEVRKICDELGIENWSLEGGLVNVDGHVFLGKKGLTHIPLKFGTVTGRFDCSENKLTSLVGCPLRVGEWFNCEWNKLTSLEGCPKSVGGSFYCDGNGLTSLVGCPKSVGQRFWCQNNYIKEFTGIKYIDVALNCGGNPIKNIWDIISPNGEWNEEHMELFNDLDIIQDGGQAVVIDRLNYFLEEIGRPTVEKVEGYINI